MAPWQKYLQTVVSPEDTTWRYYLRDLPSPKPEDGIVIKFITVKHTGIILTFEKHSTNRILTQDPPEKFIVVSFASFRFEDAPNKSTDYIQRMLTAGIV